MRIKDICSGVTDGSHNPPQGLENSDYLMLSSKNVFDDKITFDSPRYLSQIDFEQESKRTRIKSGDVLLTIVGTVGRAAVVGENMIHTAYNQLPELLFNSSLISLRIWSPP